MKKITVLLPADDTETHVEAACDGSKFEIDGLGQWSALPGHHYTPKDIRLKEKQKKGRNKIINDPIGHLMVLPTRDNSVITFVPHSPHEKIFEEVYLIIVKHFQDLNLLVETRAEPWRKSPPEKRERDKTIWECRNLGETWERTAELANCGVTTAKERYFQMQRNLDDD